MWDLYVAGRRNNNYLRGLCSCVSLFGLLVVLSLFCLWTSLFVALFLVFSFTLSPSLFTCGPFNLCGKLGLAIAWKRGIIVPGEPRGQSGRKEDQGGNKQFLCVFCLTVMQKCRRMRGALEAFNISTWAGMKHAKTLVWAQALNNLAVH